jgi:hypothetical protein
MGPGPSEADMASIHRGMMEGQAMQHMMPPPPPPMLLDRPPGLGQHPDPWAFEFLQNEIHIPPSARYGREGCTLA